MTGRPEQMMETTAQTMTYGGAGTAIVSGITLSQIGVVVGIAVGIVGLALQIWYTMRRDRREQELHRQRMSGKP